METKTTPPTMSIGTAFTLYMEQLAKLSILQEKTGLKRSEIVRRAIDELYKQLTSNDDPHSNEW